MEKHTHSDQQSQAPSGKYFALSPELAKELRAINLHASEWRLWSYLVTLDPFGDRYQELPDLVDILTECDISKATFYRALAKFEEHKLFDTQPLRIAFRNLRGQRIVSSVRNSDSSMRQPDSPMRISVSQVRLSSEEKISELLQQKGSEISPDVPITDQTFKKNKTENPTHHPVLLELDKKELGTSATNPSEVGMQELLNQVAESGIKPNKTISKTIASLHSSQGSAATAKAVENALSAYREQQQQGTVQNPGGFITAALRRGFTANQAKKDRRERSTSPSGARSPSGPAPSSPPTQTQSKPPIHPPLDTRSLFASVHQAVQQGDRQFALARLQHYWAEGWQEEVEDLCITFKRDWGFIITAQGIRDGRG
jgi:hypothetical protein